MPIKAIFASVVLSFALCGTSYALTDAEYAVLKKTSPEFAQSEKELNSTWKSLMSRVPNEATKKSMIKEQSQWLKDRDVEAKRLMASGKGKGAAYAEANHNRVDVLKQSKVNDPAKTRINIFDAAKKGDVDAVKEALAGGAKVNATDSEMWTPLHYAADKGHIGAVKVLIAAGADVNAAGKHSETPLLCTDDAEIAKILIAAGAELNVGREYDEVIIHIAAEAGNTEKVKVLVAGGADVNTMSLFGMTPLHFAASKGKLDTVKALIALGAWINPKRDDHCTPLDLAVENGHKKTADFLRSKGARSGE